MPAGADIFTNFIVLEEQLKGVRTSSVQELLLRATAVKLKHSQVIAYNGDNGETANLAHNSQCKRDFKPQRFSPQQSIY